MGDVVGNGMGLLGAFLAVVLGDLVLEVFEECLSCAVSPIDTHGLGYSGSSHVA